VSADYPTVLELVGATPIVRLDKLGAEVSPTLLAKLEYLNPGGSLKDRIGLPLIEAAERDGKLRPGGTIVEPTSGNTGVGLAIGAAIKGYRCIFVMPDKMSQEMIALLRAFGAEVVVCPTAVEPESPESYYSVSDRLAEEIPGAYKPDQYSNEENPRAHYETTGPELWEQTGGRITHFVAGLGTSGTVMGTGRRLKEEKRPIRVIAVEPEDALHGLEGLKHMGSSLVPAIWRPSESVDEIMPMPTEEGWDAAERLARDEGLFVGHSAGAVPDGGKACIVCILPDRGDRYFTPLKWEKQYEW